jgi:hypothetical protein
VNSLDSTHAASQEPTPQWRGAGPASVPARLPAAAAHPGELVASPAQSTADSDQVADELAAAVLKQKTVYDPFVAGGTTPAVAVRLAQQRLAEAA